MNTAPAIQPGIIPLGLRNMVDWSAYRLGKPPLSPNEIYLMKVMSHPDTQLTIPGIKRQMPLGMRTFTSRWVLPRAMRKGLVWQTGTRFAPTDMGFHAAFIPKQYTSITLRNLAYLAMFAACGEMTGGQFLVNAESVFGRSRFGRARSSRIAGPGNVYSFLRFLESRDKLLVSRMTEGWRRLRIYNLTELGRQTYEAWLPVWEKQ